MAMIKNLCKRIKIFLYIFGASLKQERGLHSYNAKRTAKDSQADFFSQALRESQEALKKFDAHAVRTILILVC